MKHLRSCIVLAVLLLLCLAYLGVMCWCSSPVRMKLVSNWLNSTAPGLWCNSFAVNTVMSTKIIMRPRIPSIDITCWCSRRLFSLSMPDVTSKPIQECRCNIEPLFP